MSPRIYFSEPEVIDSRISIADRIVAALAADEWYLDEAGRLLHLVKTKSDAWNVQISDTDNLGPYLESIDVIRATQHGAPATVRKSAQLCAALSAPLKAAAEQGLPRCVGAYQLPVMIPSLDGTRLVPAYTGQKWGGWLMVGEGRPPLQESTFPHLKAWLSDLRFNNPAHAGNLITWLVAAMARPGADQFPHLVVGGIKSSGKSRLARACATIVAGQAPPLSQYSMDDTKLEPGIAKNLRDRGPNVILFDNVAGTRRSAALVGGSLLCMLATSHSVLIRKLYVGSVPLTSPLVIMSMNNARISADLSDRIVYVEPAFRGTAQNENYYFNPDPLAYAEQHGRALQDELMYLAAQVRLDGGEEHANFRFPLLNRIAPVVESFLGIPVKLGRDDSGATDVDSSMLELYNATTEVAEGPQPTETTFVNIANLVHRRAEFYPELYQLLLNSGGSANAWSRALRRFMQTNAHRRITYDGRVFMLDMVSIRNRYGIVTRELTCTPV